LPLLNLAQRCQHPFVAITYPLSAPVPEFSNAAPLGLMLLGLGGLLAARRCRTAR